MLEQVTDYWMLWFNRMSIFIDVETSVLSCTRDLDIDLNFLGDLYFEGCTDFWIQNSRLFPDFFQNNSFIFQTHSYQILVGDQ